jgi:glycine/D-amino acid oxidase-like deaminating enzyme
MPGKTIIIIGGGVAGISCAMRLLEAGQDFLLITEDLGGRIKYAQDSKVNFGAYFVMSNYANARQVLTTGDWLNPLDACFHLSTTKRYAVLSSHTLGLLPELLRFYRTMWEFSRHYRPYKQHCLVMPQKAALESDPYMVEIFSMPAPQFVRAKKFERAAAEYLSEFAYACTGASMEQLTALDFLTASQGMVLPIYKIVFNAEAMAQKLGRHLAYDSILRIESQAGEHTLTGKSRQVYQAEKIVVATPAAVTQQLLGLKEIRAASQLHVFHVNARLKPEFRRHSLNMLPYSSEIMLTLKQHDGTYLVYSRTKEVDLHKVCEQFDLLASMHWEKAMYVHGAAYLEQQYGNDVYIAGDHNGLGLEPAAISGIFAANQILDKRV